VVALQQPAIFPGTDLTVVPTVAGPMIDRLHAFPVVVRCAPGLGARRVLRQVSGPQPI
jgi:hypothetical protein